MVSHVREREIVLEAPHFQYHIFSQSISEDEDMILAILENCVKEVKGRMIFLDQLPNCVMQNLLHMTQ